MIKKISMLLKILILFVICVSLVGCTTTTSSILNEESGISIMGKPDKLPVPDDMFDHGAVHNIDGTSTADAIIIGEGEYTLENYPLYTEEGKVYQFSIKAYAGDDLINLRAIFGVENSIDAGDGDDVVYDSNYNDTTMLGKGKDFIEITGGFGWIQGEEGDDTLCLILDEFLNAPEPQDDPGGPFSLFLKGGSNARKAPSDFDTLEIIMTAEHIELEYDFIISSAFEAMKSNPKARDTNLEELDPALKIYLYPDIENLRIKEGDVLIYEYVTQ